MNKAIFWGVTMLALLLNGFGVYDLYMTIMHDPAYLQHVPAEMIAMIDAFPEWRRLLWIVGIFMAAIAAVLMLLRMAMAERVFWATAAFMGIGFLGYDLPFGNGLEGYGTAGVIFSFVLIGIQAAFALYARRAARHGMLR
ncbi:hypothetical protein [Parasphingopyxis marina]|uniref:Uncharacterized protein n=1 Tax=Parasphingopyxis marina TaxID=2761622 RepID=A0A842HWT6_9SPHN|nr:hypothetical protein [Parasphingopyxis marina]MBC2776867.1 hypothetical protein [Parasphingopyxis marina]